MPSNFELTQRFIPFIGWISLIGHTIFFFLCGAVFGFIESAPMRFAVAIGAVPFIFYPRHSKISVKQRIYWEAQIAFDALTSFWYFLMANSFNSYWFASTVFAAMAYGLFASRIVVIVTVPFFVSLGIFIAAMQYGLPAGWISSSCQVFAVSIIGMIISLSLRFTFDIMYRQLKAAHTKLKDLDKAKSEFFQNISHEFRTPLTLIIGPIESALAGRFGSLTETMIDNLNIVKRNCRRLLRLISQILDVSKIDAGAMEINRVNADVVPLLSGIVSAYESAAKQKGIELSWIPQQKEIIASVDCDMIDKIVNNLLSNALKFTNQGGKIRVNLNADSTHFTLSVKDTGCGIPLDKQAIVFERFRQVDSSTTRQHEGTGIGLALAKELIELHKGQIVLSSEVDFGTEFRVCIPIACSLSKVQATIQPQHISETTKETASVALYEGQSLPAHVPAIDINGHNLDHVLIAEDNSDMQAYIKSCLSSVGYRVTCVENGLAGLDMASRILPDIIISDVMMPVMDGIDFLIRCRSKESLKEVPFIILTAKVGDDLLVNALRSGADDYLTKPFNAEELIARVDRLISIKKLSRENARLHDQYARNALSRYLSPSIVDQVMDGTLQLYNEPRSEIITVLFSDLVGFTAHTENIRAQMTSRLLNEYWDAMTNVIFKHNGTVEKFVGDAIMVLFGAPVTISPFEQATKAASCAIQMQEEMVKLNNRWSKDGISVFKMRIGVHQGPAVIGHFGNKQSSHFTAVGSTVNMASRVEGVCDPDSVFVTTVVADHLPSQLITLAGSFELKGIPNQIQLYRLNFLLDATL